MGSVRGLTACDEGCEGSLAEEAHQPAEGDEARDGDCVHSERGGWVVGVVGWSAGARGTDQRRWGHPARKEVKPDYPVHDETLLPQTQAMPWKPGRSRGAFCRGAGGQAGPFLSDGWGAGAGGGEGRGVQPRRVS